MYGVQSAIAIKRERKKRESVKGGAKAPLPVISRAQLKPPVQKANLTYFNVGASFILIGSFLVLTSVIPDDILGRNWTSLIPIGILLIILGIIMVTINQIQTRREDKELEIYVKHRLEKTSSGNPLIHSSSTEDNLNNINDTDNSGKKFEKKSKKKSSKHKNNHTKNVENSEAHEMVAILVPDEDNQL